MTETHVHWFVEIQKVAILKSNPPGLFVAAIGKVGTSGWTNGALLARQYIVPPEDGMQDFDFVAHPPEGVVLPMESLILGEGFLSEIPSWMRGFRIVTANDSFEYEMHPEEPALLSLLVPEEDTDRNPPVLSSFSKGIGGAEQAEVEIDEISETIGVFVLSESGERCHSFDLIKLSELPEFKIDTESRCMARIGGRCAVRANVPVLYRRTTTLIIEAQVCWPKGKDIASDIEECAKAGLLAGVATLLLTGNLAGGAAALKTALIGCLVAKGHKFADKINVNLRERRKSTSWRKV
jgi:hypothetical protein